MAHAKRWAGKGWPTLLGVLTCLLLVSIPAAAARALVSADCDTEDDFCTGDPCVTPDKIEVTAASCVLDFGSRELVIAHPIIVPNGGILSLTAGSIEIQRRIRGRHVQLGAGDGAHISLIAGGDVTIRKRVDASARFSSGSILIDAGGNVEIRRALRTRVIGRGATATGGTITVIADGTVSSTIRGKIDARGRKRDTAGGQVSINATAGVGLKSRIDVRGSTGGDVSITSGGGNVTLAQKIRANGTADSGGSVTVEAQGDIEANTRARVEADGKPGNVGMVTFSAAGTIDVDTLSARGSSGGGGGSINVVGGTVSVNRLFARGKDTGGTIAVTSTAGNLLVGKVDARASGDGGSILLTSFTDLNVYGTATVEGNLTGGEMRFAANGNMVLQKSFDATGASGGTIEGLAGGDLTTDGKFKAAVGGCVGLAAGGTLDTSGATFDVPTSGSCP